MTRARSNTTHAKQRPSNEARPRGVAGAAKACLAMVRNKPHQGWFVWFANAASHWSGKPVTFLAAVAIIVLWAASGPLFGYSDTWQLVINTGTTIVTFLMVFLIQNTQNRDTLSLQIKLSELIIAMRGAHNQMAAVEDMSDEELDALHAEYRKRAETLESITTQRGSRAEK